MSNVHLIKKEQCPRCKELGKDNSKDNLAIYSDGHSFCYACKYATFPNGVESFKNKQCIQEVMSHKVFLPVDCDIIYPQRALSWVEKYELTKNDLYVNNVMWSEQLQRLIFPVYDNDGGLVLYSGRSFSLQQPTLAPIPKWIIRGNKLETFHILGKGGKIVPVEDVVSAIKVAKCGYRAMPLYGTFIGEERFKRLLSLPDKVDEVIIWLDSDKRKEAVLEAIKGNLYLPCRVVFSEKDPKDENYEEIRGILS